MGKIRNSFIPRIFIILAVLAAAMPSGSASAAAGDSIAPGTIRADATFEAIGVVWPVGGDDNHNSNMTLEFRKSGESAWHAGAPATRAYPTIIVDGSPLGLNYWAASALFLQPGQAYELRLTLTDPDGGGATRTVNASTRSGLEPDANGRQLYVVPGSGGGNGSQANPLKGLQAAADAAQPGDVFHLAVGTYAPFQLLASGTPGHPITFRGPDTGKAVVDGGGTDRGIVTLGEYDQTIGYVIVEGLTIQNGNWGVDAQNDHDILLRHNTITNVANGILNRRGDGLEANQTITDNVIQGRTPWPGSGIPEEEGIDLRGTGNVVAYNRVQAFGDCISVNPFTSDSYGNDVVGNDVSYCVDDGIEIDANMANARTWRNRVMNSRMGISVQPVRGGPAYIFRNEFFNLESNPIKMHNETTGFWVVHNTGAKIGNAQGDDGSMWRNAVFRNNLLLGTAYAFEFTTQPDEGFRDLDYDAWGTTRSSPPLFKWNDVRYNTLADLKATGVEAHGIMAQFAHVLNASLPAAWNVAVAPGSRDLRLAAAAPEIDAGAALPNLNDIFITDGKPDMGAFEAGQPLPAYGPRPAAPDLSASSKSASRGAAAPGQTITYTILLRNAGSPASAIHASDSLPAGMVYLGNLQASSGSAAYASGVVTWVGDVTSAAPVTIRFDATPGASVITPTAITNTVSIEDGLGGTLLRQATVVANGMQVYIPVTKK